MRDENTCYCMADFCRAAQEVIRCALKTVSILIQKIDFSFCLFILIHLHWNPGLVMWWQLVQVIKTFCYMSAWINGKIKYKIFYSSLIEVIIQVWMISAQLMATSWSQQQYNWETHWPVYYVLLGPIANFMCFRCSQQISRPSLPVLSPGQSLKFKPI